MDQKIEDLKKMPLAKIALRIKAYRKQYGITQETLARRIGVKRYTLLRWENAKVRISTAFMRILVEEGVL